MENPVSLIFNIIEIPDAKRPYRKLKEYFVAKGQENEAQAIQHLLETRFNDNDTNPSQE